MLWIVYSLEYDANAEPARLCSFGDEDRAYAWISQLRSRGSFKKLLIYVELFV